MKDKMNCSWMAVFDQAMLCPFIAVVSRILETVRIVPKMDGGTSRKLMGRIGNWNRMPSVVHSLGRTPQTVSIIGNTNLLSTLRLLVID